MAGKRFYKVTLTDEERGLLRTMLSSGKAAARKLNHARLLLYADEALEHVGWEPDLLDTRGVILTRLGKLDEAIKDLESAASAMPSGPVYYHLAKAYRKQGRGDEFRKARDRAKQAGLRPEQLQPSERWEWDDIMTQ